MADPALTPFTIDVVSDVVCPWCFIGKRRLEAALALAGPDGAAQAYAVRWHPFELNPGLPRGGIDRRAYLESKFGGRARVEEVLARVRAAGATAGVAFALDRIARMPNTRDAHRLVDWAQGQREAGALVEGLFRAFFVEGRDIGDRGVLAAVAAAAGFDLRAARAALESDAGAGAVERAERRALELGVGGVPFFVFGGRVALAGAHEPRVIAQAIAEARAAAA
jgi:predicted DsbA family dithiol-disulfide isomerase